MDQSRWVIGPYLFSTYLTPSSSWVLPGSRASVETQWSSPLQLRRRISKLTFSYLFYHHHHDQQNSDCKPPRPVSGSGPKASPAAAPPVHTAFPSNRTPSQPVSREESENVDIKYAQQGFSLLQTSLVHLEQSPSFARQLYIHALVYLLQALPAHLSDHETTGLRSAIPRSCLLDVADTSSRVNGSGGARVTSRNDHRGGLGTTSHPKRHDDYRDHPSISSSSSYLHRAFSTFTSAAVRSYQNFLPYFLVIGKMLVYYDHEYRIHERFIGIFLAVMRIIWSYIVVAVDPTLLIWCMAEMTAGVGEGWKRAMMMGKERDYG